MDIIKFDKISFSYGRRKGDLPIIKNFELSIAEKEITLIYGKSGLGKTTILNIIAGLLKPQQGQVIVDEQNIYDLSARELDKYRSKKIGFIFQMFYLIPQFTAVDNVVIGMKNIRGSYQEKRKIAMELLDRLEIGDKGETYPELLSGGQQQRVAIARALANDSKIILADEPTGNLDKDTASEVSGILEQLRNEGKTIVIVSHDEHMKEISDRIVMLDKEYMSRTGVM
ncbi:MAG: ABC transporter ATP-binding protein [Clostridiales bacterium]|nr:ABC transporter ATP-binding protein [Clostridiales bacterium]